MKYKKVVIVAALALALATLATLAVMAFSTSAQNGLMRRHFARTIGVERNDLVATDAMRVAICGSASPMPDASRAQSCAVVFAAGKYWIVDAGPGSWDRIARWGIPHRLIGGVFITHFHSDHIGALGEFNMQSWALGRPEQLAVYGGPGVDRVVAGFNDAYALDRTYRTAHHGPKVMPPSTGPMRAITITATDGGPLRGEASATVLEVDGLKVTAVAVDHHPVEPAYGFRFDFAGRSAVFSGDTTKTRGLAIVAKGADLLIHSAQAQDLVEIMEAEAARAGQDRLRSIFADIRTYQSKPADVAAVAREAEVRAIVMTHLNPPLPNWLAERVFRRGTEAAGAIPIRLAHDGLLVTMPAGSSEIRYGDLTH